MDTHLVPYLVQLGRVDAAIDSGFKTMSTPTHFSIPPPDARDVVARLDAELQHQEAATPEPIFRDPTSEHSYGWQCESEHLDFTAG